MEEAKSKTERELLVLQGAKGLLSNANEIGALSSKNKGVELQKRVNVCER